MGRASEHSSHQAAVVQVCEVAARRDYDKGAIKKAFAKRDRRMRKGTTTATAGRKTVNKSCDTCSIKKRRCDGGRPCSRCVRWEDGHKCTYSTRRPYTSTNRRYRLWSSPTSSEQAAKGTASATSGSPCRKSSMEPHCHGNDKVGQNTSVIEASPTAGPMATPKIECSSPAIDEVYAELARAQQGVMSLIVSTNSLPPQASNNGPYQQTMMKQHPVPYCELDEACNIGVGYAEMMPRTMSLEGQNSQKSGDVPGLEIDCPVPASPAALVRDVSTDDDGHGSTLDHDVNIIPSSWSDDDTLPVVHDVSVISFDQPQPPMGKTTTDITAAVAPEGESLDQSLWALEKKEEDAISAEDWFEVAVIL